MSNYLIIIIFLIVLLLGYFQKVNCFEAFLEGSKEGLKTAVNMFSSLLTFTIAISLLFSSGLIDKLQEIISFDYGIILIQVIIRPLSSSSSLSILMKCYETYGIDSFISLISTGIHYVSDASFYIIPFYCSLYSIKKYEKILLLGLIINIISYIIVILIITFYYIFVFS